MDIERLLVELAMLGIEFVATLCDDHRIHIVADSRLLDELERKAGTPVLPLAGFNVVHMKGYIVEYTSKGFVSGWQPHALDLWPLSIHESRESYQMLYYYMRGQEDVAEAEEEIDYTSIHVVNNSTQHKRPGDKRREREQRKAAYLARQGA